MSTSLIRVVALTGATLALVLAGTTVVAAHPGRDDDDRGFGRPFRGGFGEFREGPFGGPGALGMRWLDGLVRHETTYQTEEGLMTLRVDQGAVVSVSDSSLEYTLPTDGPVSVAVDDETQVIGFTQETGEFGRGWSRERWVAELLEIGEIAADSEVRVWATAQDGGSFTAERIVVLPDAEDAEGEAIDEGIEASPTPDLPADSFATPEASPEAASA